MVSVHSEISPMLPLKWFQCLCDWWWPSLVLSRKIVWHQCYKWVFLLSFLLFSSVSITATKVIPSWIQMCHSSPWLSIGMTTKDSMSKPSFKGTSPLKYGCPGRPAFNQQVTITRYFIHPSEKSKAFNQQVTITIYFIHPSGKLKLLFDLIHLRIVKN